MKITINCDGGARGNPGHAAVGCVVQNANLKMKDQNEKCKIFEISKYIGTATNNQAEYRAVIVALEWIIENRDEIDDQDNRENLEIECLLDSELVVEQLNQRYKVKNEDLKPLFWQVRDLILKLGGKVTFRHIPREQNKRADALVNKALDEEVKSNKNITTV